MALIQTLAMNQDERNVVLPYCTLLPLSLFFAARWYREIGQCDNVQSSPGSACNLPYMFMLDARRLLLLERAARIASYTVWRIGESSDIEHNPPGTRIPREVTRLRKHASRDREGSASTKDLQCGPSGGGERPVFDALSWRLLGY